MKSALQDQNGQKEKLAEAFSLLSQVNREAYNNIMLLSNQVLSKNTVTNNFLPRFLQGQAATKVSTGALLLKLTRYYFYSFKDYASYLKEIFQYLLNNAAFRPRRDKKNLIIIDTFFLLDKIIREGRLIDRHFSGLAELLERKGLHFVYLPIFDGMKRGFSFLMALKILNEQKIPVIYEYQMLTLTDLLRIIYFILLYPFYVLRLAYRTGLRRREGELLKHELLDTLDQPVFRNFSRYLQGRNICRLPYEKVQVISWYENQALHKNLYKGLRSNPAKVKIYGAQLFLYSSNLLNINPDENELEKKIIPDKILVNGLAFLPAKSRLNYCIGPSLRYARIFNSQIMNYNQKNILVLLPYFREEIENILRVVGGVDTLPGAVYIKPHPAQDIKKFGYLLPPNTIIVDNDIYKLFETTKILIGAASGTLLEAASLGIPVVSIKNSSYFGCNPLPEYGKGAIWEEAGSSDELSEKINHLNYRFFNDYEMIKNIAGEYKQMFFCQPTEEKVIESFDLELVEGCA